MEIIKRNRDADRVWAAKNKWRISLYSARTRCRNKKATGYSRYGGRGIRCFLTVDETRILWIRDGGANLVKATIDRINPDGDYEFSNCQFIEYTENMSKIRRGVFATPLKFCSNGHKYTQNTVIDSRGWRQCGPCHVEALLKRGRLDRASRIAMEIGGKTHRKYMKYKKIHFNIGGQISKCGYTLSGILDKFSEAIEMVDCGRCLHIVNQEQIYGIPKSRQSNQSEGEKERKP